MNRGKELKIKHSIWSRAVVKRMFNFNIIINYSYFPNYTQRSVICLKTTNVLTHKLN